MSSALSPQEFIRTWKNSPLTERAAYQEHFRGLCQLVGHPTPAEVDPDGTWFGFEVGATKTSGKQGWADVWKKDFFAIEYKGPGKNLDAAYEQLLKYRESLNNPPLLIVCDLERIIIHTNFTRTAKKVIELSLDDLATSQGLQTLRNVFFDPDAFKTTRTTEQVTEDAAAEFAKLADLIRRYHPQLAAEEIAHFLIRLLFCLFAEDVGLLPEQLFSQLINKTRGKASIFAQQLESLFQEMSTGGYFGADEIRHFNGKLFNDARVMPLSSDALDILLKVSKLDWSAIEPAIFGTLFERSLDPSKRSQLGAHYTSRDDILLIIEPVLMQPLRREWEQVRSDIRDLAAKRDAASTHTRHQKMITEQLQAFLHTIHTTTVLDPACGSGNFLYVALKQLLDLEKEVLVFGQDMGLPLGFPHVGPEQLFGIEINEYAYELAQVTVWIGYIQWLRDNGFGSPADPVLKPLETIRNMDALLAINEEGVPYKPDWPETIVVTGNPPFLGGKKLRTELGDMYVDTLFDVYEGQLEREADLVCYWFKNAHDLIANNRVQRAGFIATNSIRGGANRKVLEDIKESGNIFMAWSDREWVLDGAAVRVSIIGFDSGEIKEFRLNDTVVEAIHPDLTGLSNLTLAQPLKENKNIAFMGDTKVGSFDISEEIAYEMLAQKGNPHGRSNSDVVVPWMNGMDVTRRPRNMWIIDFGPDASYEEAAEYEAPFEYVKTHVRPVREKNAIQRLREKWWIHRVPGAAMRERLSNLPRFIVTPSVSKYRLFTWLSPDVVPDHQLYAIARDDDYFFGALHSRLHELWALRMGTSLEDRPRYTPTTTFETFPFPWPPGTEPTDDPRVLAIADAARELVEKRDRWLDPEGATEQELKKRTLTNLYNQRPAWLDIAHQKLDKAVLDAYGWPHDLSEEEILERLLKLNLERAAAQEKD